MKLGYDISYAGKLSQRKSVLNPNNYSQQYFRVRATEYSPAGADTQPTYKN